jgi:hypothetical protein
VSLAHDVLHPLLPHTYAPHDVAVCATQLPAPSHLLAGVNVEPEQIGLVHVAVVVA